jgi:hypothetical protein
VIKRKQTILKGGCHFGEQQSNRFPTLDGLSHLRDTKQVVGIIKATKIANPVEWQ